MSVGGIRISRLNRKTVLNPTNDIFVMSVQGSATTNGLTFKTLIDNLQAAIAAGPLNAIQFNNPLGELDGSTDFLWDDNAKTLTITGAANASVFNGVALTASGSSLDFLNAEGDYVPVLGSGDMLASVYDPTTVSADAFSMGNMDETATAKVLTNLERLEIAANTSKVSNVTTNLSIGTATATTLDINSSDGTNATIPEAIASGNAGLLSGSNKADIATNNGKVSNVTTNLSIGAATGTTLDVESSDGTNATLPETTALDAGLLSVAKRGEIIANTAKVSNVSTNLSIGTATATTLDVNSSDGTNATLPQAVAATSAGLLSGTDKEKIDGGWSKTVFSSYKVGTTADPSTTAETPATAPVLAEMTHTFTPAKETTLIKVKCGCSFDKTGGGDDGVRMAVFVDGVVQTETTRRDFVGSNDDYDTSLHTFWSGSLSVAAHTIDVRFWGTDDTMIAVDVERNFYIEEIDTI